MSETGNPEMRHRPRCGMGIVLLRIVLFYTSIVLITDLRTIYLRNGI